MPPLAHVIYSKAKNAQGNQLESHTDEIYVDENGMI